jgi:hypothetical protein
MNKQKKVKEIKQSVSISLDDLVEFKNEVVMLRNTINAHCSIIIADKVQDAAFLMTIGEIQKACSKLDKYFAS